MDISIFLLLSHAVFVYGDLHFGQANDFHLTASKTFFLPNDDVTFTCEKGASYDSDNDPRSLVFPSSKGVTWERNGQSLFSTSREGKKCHLQPEMVLGRPAVTQRELQAVSCAENDTSVSVTIRNVTVSPTGDRWVCSKFPFLESNPVSLHNFVALSDVTLSVQDHFPDDFSTGILMTLVCQASPCNPPPSVTWHMTRDGHELPLPDQSRTRSHVDDYGRVVLAMELALTADSRYENATVSCSASNAHGAMDDRSLDVNGGDADAVDDDTWIQSETVKLTVKRPPRILLTINPANQVTEGTVVTLTCGAHGHPRPEVRWRKENGYLPGGLMEAETPIIRLNPARAPDQGQYTCRAFNGVAPEAVNSVFLTVNEPVRTLKISDENQSTEIAERESTGQGTESRDPTTSFNANDDNNNNNNNNNNINNNNGDDTDDARAKARASAATTDNGNGSGENGGTIAAIVISVLVLMGGVVLLVLWLLSRRRKQHFASPGSIASLFTHYPERSMTAPRAGMYAPRSSRHPTTLTPLTLEAFPQYLDLPPAPSPPVGILNRGYGMSSSNRVNKGRNGRPLPAAPTSEVRGNPLAYGYDEIRDVSGDERRMTSSDGYEVPVLPEEDEEEEDEEEECVYDVARFDSLSREERASGRGRATYMNDDSFSTHM